MKDLKMSHALTYGRNTFAMFIAKIISHDISSNCRIGKRLMDMLIASLRENVGLDVKVEERSSHVNMKLEIGMIGNRS